MKKIFTLLVAVISVSIYTSAQVSIIKSENGRDGMYPAYIEFANNAAPPHTKGTVFLQGPGFQRTPNNPILVKTEFDNKGGEHYRYQQTINNVPIEGAIYISHVYNGKILSQNGKWVKILPTDLATSAAISKDAAIGAAMTDFGASKYKWQLKGEEAFLKKETNDVAATFYPDASLVYYTGEEDIIPEKMKLAYKLDVYAQEPVGRRIYFIDATTGQVLGKRELIHTTDATGSAVTAYSGTQTITTDLYNGSYRLRGIGGRGNGVQTYNMKKGTNYNAAVDFTDADNTWNNVNANLDQYAADAHWGAEKTYDYFKSKYDRNSIDGNGFTLKSYVHYSTNYFNAYWDGSRMTYGDGSATDNYKPLTAIDVAGHEITHGLTTFTANLNYSYESGAMNEGFSDIFGTAIEAFARPTQNDWLIGADFYTLRSMSNPNAYGDPDTYKGTNWYAGSGDNGGVHTNSGVLNYWFYLLSAGGSGTNDLGTAFNVSGLGIDNAAAIAYRTLTVYLISTSNYANCRTFSIKAAEDLFGVGSNAAIQTTNAWNAVGVGVAAPPPVTCADAYEANETRTTSKSIATNTDISAKIGTSSDKDWFKFTTTTAAPNVKVTLTNLPYDYDLRLYNSAGSQLRISQNGGITSETATYNTSAAGTYYVQVYGYGGANSNSICYLLRANTSGTRFLGEATDAGITSIKDLVNSNSLSVFPNPAKNLVNFNLSSDVDTQKEVIVLDLMGRMVLKQKYAIQKGNNTIKINLPRLAPGIYFIKIDSNKLQRFEVTK